MTTQMKTPEQIATEIAEPLGRSSLGPLFPVNHEQIIPVIVAAIEADRTQRAGENERARRAERRSLKVALEAAAGVPPTGGFWYAVSRFADVQAARELRRAAEQWAADPERWGDYRNELRDRAEKLESGAL